MTRHWKVLSVKAGGSAIGATLLGCLLVSSALGGTILGTPRDDTIRGTAKADRLFGRAGNDRLSGTFDASGTTVSGRFQIHRSGPINGTHYECDSGGADWSAKWQA